MDPILTWESTWQLPATVLFLAATVVLAWSYRLQGLRSRRLPGFLLRSTALAALALCLLDPHWSHSRAKPGANLFALVADNSQGLQIRDRDANQSRGDQLRSLLANPNGGWQSALSETFELRRFQFDRRLESATSLETLRFDGPATALGDALRRLAGRFKARPLAGILLFTDGNATDLSEAEVDQLSGLPPVYPVVIGSDRPPNDLAIREVTTGVTAFEDLPVTIQAEVTADGFANRDVLARLLDSNGREVMRETQKATEGHATLNYRFQIKPERPGLSFYQLQVSPLGILLSGQSPGEEATLANNQRSVVVDRGSGPHRILYVAGRPNWEYKFLRRAIDKDPQLDMVALIRIARREAKFAFRGRAGETSNPLFRGFATPGTEELERYDQPVLKRLNTRDDLELATGFPTKPEELYAYEAIVVDDVEAEFFSADQALLIQKFVSDRGGGFLMLGGTESFREGHYARTPIGELLPVYLDRPDEPASTALLVFQLTREGMLQPWTRLRKTEAEERSRLESMPPFQVLNRVRESKPGATVLATVGAPGETSFPALVVQHFGRGQSAALTLGDFWRWGQKDPAAHEDLEKAWRQFLRWLVSDVPRPVELTLQTTTSGSSGPVRFQVRVRDRKFQPQDNASVALDIRPSLVKPGETGSTNLVHLTAEASQTEPGLYEASFVPRMAAAYEVNAWATNSDGIAMGHAQAGWSSDPAAEEFRSLVPNRPLLEALARHTGGKVIPTGQLQEFAHSISGKAAPVMETVSQPLWHSPVLFGLALACLTAEWGLRRRRGLP